VPTLRRELAEEELAVAHDRREEIVEVVRDAARELPHRFHLLRLTELCLKLPLLGHVDAHAKHGDRQSRLVHLLATFAFQPANRPVGSERAASDVEHLAVDLARFEAALNGSAILRVHEGEERVARLRKRTRGKTENGAHAVGADHPAAGEVRLPDANARRREREVRLLMSVPERSVGFLDAIRHCIERVAQPTDFIAPARADPLRVVTGRDLFGGPGERMQRVRHADTEHNDEHHAHGYEDQSQQDHSPHEWSRGREDQRPRIADPDNPRCAFDSG
jgi:hypothetical protein